MVTISVIIPNYNYADFVGAAIESVLSQTFRDFELIVVDDGSTDNSRNVIGSYAGRLKARYIDNIGAARACLRGISEASGRYIYILDSDDEIMSDTLAAVAENLTGNPAKVQFQLAPVDSRGQVIGPPFPRFCFPYTRDSLLEEIRRNGYYLTPPTSGNVFRADVFQIIGDISYEKWIDGITYLICPFLGEVVTIPRALARYRVHGRNASRYGGQTPEIFKRERLQFISRINHLEALQPTLGTRSNTIDRRLLSYIPEMEIMELAAAGQTAPPVLVFRYWRALVHSLMSLRAKLVLAAWAALFLLPSAQVRRTLVLWRCNPWARPNMLRWLKSVIHR